MNNTKKSLCRAAKTLEKKKYFDSNIYSDQHKIIIFPHFINIKLISFHILDKLIVCIASDADRRKRRNHRTKAKHSYSG